MMMFDTHIHLDRIAAERPLDEEIASARAAGVGQFLVPGVDRKSWCSIQQVTGEIDGSLAAFGLHPLAAAEWDGSCRDELVSFLAAENTVAIGEIGLDRFLNVPLVCQEQAFREQLQVAIEHSLPVLVHCRKMIGRLLEVLREEQADRVGGIMHAFGGSEQTARELIDLGFVLSFGGALTYPEAHRISEMARRLPENSIVIETDAPDLAPHPHRGEVNRPVWLALVARRLAEIRGWSLEKTAELTTANARRILKLD